MADRLEILAIEPFYGGQRRLMLETLMKRSRHQWTLLKLPGRRIERRLEAAAQWFGEVLQRRGIPACDLLFTSEAMNLSDLFNLVPELSGRPAVVYFHENQLPAPGRPAVRPIDHVNALTALEASEIWFNSMYHLRSFSGKLAGVVKQLPNLFEADVPGRLTARASLLAPPVELEALKHDGAGSGGVTGNEKVFVDLRGADTRLLAGAMRVLKSRGREVELVTVGARGELPAELSRTVVPDVDETAVVEALAGCGAYMSVGTGAMFDAWAVMAMAAGKKILVPDGGAYTDLIPLPLHGTSLYQPNPECLASAIQELSERQGTEVEEDRLEAFEAGRAVRAMDDRLVAVTRTYHEVTSAE